MHRHALDKGAHDQRAAAIDPVTRASSRVEFIETEFNGTGVRSSYIWHQVSASDAASR